MNDQALRAAHLKNESSIAGVVLRPGASPAPGPRAMPELLAPAGDWECARAAVENGADAIYFGLERFNARLRAHNFTESDLPKLMEFLHRRGVKGYVTLNTLVFQNEMAEAEQYLRTMIRAGVDAVIVQDIGICRLIRRLSPDFPIHASTQMTITSAEGAAFARQIGCSLVVLARECSLKDIAKIQAAQGFGPHPLVEAAVNEVGAGPQSRTLVRNPMPLEVFVHGALCVAYSGQCLTSEALGGRSANRGECAQACRMPYEVISDGKRVPLGDRRYLLSPQDLAGLEILPQLVEAGVASLKIEGRLKSAEYVASITRVYRQGLDALEARSAKVNGPAFNEIVRQSRYDVEMAFSRGLYTGWFEGINNQKLVHGRFGKKRGVFLGQVTRVGRDRVQLRLEAPLKAGDGVVFDAGKPDVNEEGGRVYRVDPKGAEVELTFGRGDLDLSKIHVGDRLWKTSDPELDRRVRRSFAGDQPQFQRPIMIEIHGEVGKPMIVIARDDAGNIVQLESSLVLARAESQPLTQERLEQQFGRLGGTAFKLGKLTAILMAPSILPLSELNRLRREMVRQLEIEREKPLRWALKERSVIEIDPGNSSQEHTPVQAKPPAAELIALVRNPEQMKAVWDAGVRTVYCEFEDPKKYREAVQLFRSWQNPALAPGGTGSLQLSGIFVAPPRIFKPGEEWILQQVRSCEADGYLVRNYDHLRFFEDCRRIGDYSLNVANALTAEYLKTQFSLERVTASYDLNQVQLEALLQAAPADWFEVTIHQHMPMFHMEHCVFCAFLSSGSDYTNCGRPCDKHDVQLQDRVGAKHPVKADAGCRNTVFNALAQTGAEFALSLNNMGLRSFRIEFLNESPELAAKTVAQYQRLLRGELSGTQLWHDLRLFNQLGVTRGPSENRPRPSR